MAVSFAGAPAQVTPVSVQPAFGSAGDVAKNEPPEGEGSVVPLPTVNNSVAAVGVQVLGMVNFISRSLTGALPSTLTLLALGVAVATGSMVASSLGARVIVVPPAAVLTVAALLGADRLPAASTA